MSLNREDKLNKGFQDDLHRNPLFLQDRSEEEKSANAALLNEELFWTKLKRRGEGFVPGVFAGIIITVIFFIYYFL